jgi:hypothetical protein
MFFDDPQCFLSRRSSGTIFFLNGAPVVWYSNRQDTIESSTFGSEFVALRIACEKNDALRYRLRMFGVKIDGPTKGFSDNESVIKNSTRPDSTLAKKHNSIAYHKVRECVAYKAIRLAFEAGKVHLPAILTKFLPAPAHMACCRKIYIGEKGFPQWGFPSDWTRVRSVNVCWFGVDGNGIAQNVAIPLGGLVCSLVVLLIWSMMTYPGNIWMVIGHEIVDRA